MGLRFTIFSINSSSEFVLVSQQLSQNNLIESKSFLIANSSKFFKVGVNHTFSNNCLFVILLFPNTVAKDFLKFMAKLSTLLGWQLAPSCIVVGVKL